MSCMVAGLAALSIALGELPFHPLRIPLREGTAYVFAADNETAFQDVSIAAADGTVLRGWYARPRRHNGNAVILLHGQGDNRQGMVGFAEQFFARGYAVLLPDARGHGMSGGVASYGVREVGDVRSWFDWLQRDGHAKCVYGMGESMGAAIVLQAVETTPFCAVVAESPFADFRDVAYLRVGQLFHKGPWLGEYALRPAVELAFLYGRATRGVDLTMASPKVAVEKSRVPILLIHGMMDSSIPAQHSEMIQAKNPSDVKLWEVSGAEHCGASSIEPEEFYRRVLGWFADHGTQPGMVQVTTR